VTSKTAVCERAACRKTFAVGPKTSKRRRFCSAACRRRAWEGVPLPKPIPRAAYCALEECGERFQPTRAHQRYHSDRCKWRRSYLRKRGALKAA